MRVKIRETTAPLEETSSGRITEVTDGDYVSQKCFICAGAAKIRAEGDAPIGYCSQEHKEMHHPADEEEPYPFLVKYREEVGRYVQFQAKQVGKTLWSLVKDLF